jgi:chemotaxis signal transduction protein
VREVLLRPEIVPVPHCDGVLAGLCHVRSDFLPVLSLRGLLAGDTSCATREPQMLVVNGDECAWGLLVDQVAALESLEPSIAPDDELDNTWSATVLGWASYRDWVVRVLDPRRFYRSAERMLEGLWSAAGRRSSK